MTQLSKREKTLIYILICMVVVIGGLFFLIMPSFEKYDKASSDKDAAEQQFVLLKASIPNYDDLDKNIKKVKKELTAVKKKFFDEMDKVDLDQLVTNLVKDHQLQPLSLKMGTITTEEVIPYEDYIKELKAAESKSDKKEEANQNTISAKVYNVSMTVSGTIENVQALVNDANKTYSMKVASVQYADQQDLKKEMTLTFKIFMI